MAKRVFVVVLDSFGIGEEPDAPAYGDEGSNTLCACGTSPCLHIPHMTELGLLNIDGALDSVYKTNLAPIEHPTGAFARMQALGRQRHNGRTLGDGRCYITRAFSNIPRGLSKRNHRGV